MPEVESEYVREERSPVQYLHDVFVLLQADRTCDSGSDRAKPHKCAITASMSPKENDGSSGIPDRPIQIALECI